jgi:hypothetical protein
MNSTRLEKSQVLLELELIRALLQGSDLVYLNNFLKVEYFDAICNVFRELGIQLKKLRKFSLILLFNLHARVPNRPLFQRTVFYFNQLSFIFIEPIKDEKCPLFLRF